MAVGLRPAAQAIPPRLERQAVVDVLTIPTHKRDEVWVAFCPSYQRARRVPDLAPDALSASTTPPFATPPAAELPAISDAQSLHVATPLQPPPLPPRFAVCRRSGG